MSLGAAENTASSPANRAELVEVWQTVARHLSNDALPRLKELRRTGGRENAFAEAVVLLDSQPTTDAKCRDVERRLQSLAEGDDEIADASAYLIARIHQTMLSTEDPETAARVYDQLHSRHPHSYWAQLGLMKRAVLTLFVLPGSNDPPSRVAAAEKVLPQLSFPTLQRDLHLVLGRAILFFDGPIAEARDHLIAADRIGGLNIVVQADVLIQVGELSRRTGQPELARRYFQRFLDEDLADARTYAVRMTLEKMNPAKPATASNP